MAMNTNQQSEIDSLRAVKNTTRRPTVPALEEILYEPVPVLDHGFVRVVDYMGDDAAVVQAARVSYGAGTKQAREDEGLIHYLMRHSHTTPFEMAEIKFHVKLPIFVARQWVRHRTANINEYSARYSKLDREFYIPAAEQLADQSRINRQGRGSRITATQSEAVLKLLRADAEHCYRHYVEMLNEDDDGKPIDPDRPALARELARINLTLNTYTQWYWKIDAHNLMHFLQLRADLHAQYEIRVYADVMLQIFQRWMPHTYLAFLEYRMNGVQISATELKVIQKMLAGESVKQEVSGLTKREWRELIEKLQIE